jgi:heptosyltransferase-2/heptosyltransferase-3
MLSFSRVDPARCLFIEELPGTVHHSVDRLIRFGEQTPGILRAGDYPSPAGEIPWAPHLYVSNADRVELDVWLRGQGWSGRPLIMVQPGNHRSASPRRERWRRLKTDNKEWPVERWVALFQKVHAHMPDALIMLRGVREELKMLEELRAAAGLDSVVVAEVGLRRLFALCEASHSMISVDTGPAHVAGALGLPLVVMYGAEQQRFWLPRSPTGSPVIGVGGPPHSVRVDEIPVEAVFDAWVAATTQSVLVPNVSQSSAR